MFQIVIENQFCKTVMMKQLNQDTLRQKYIRSLCCYKILPYQSEQFGENGILQKQHAGVNEGYIS